MKSIQYTIRNIPPEVDQAIKLKASKSGKSINSTALELIAEAVGQGPEVKDDLGWFYGSKTSDKKKFDSNIEWLENLPSDIK